MTKKSRAARLRSGLQCSFEDSHAHNLSSCESKAWKNIRVYYWYITSRTHDAPDQFPVGLIAQLVENCTGTAEVTVQARIFFRLTFYCKADTTWKTFRDTNMTRTDIAGSQQWTALDVAARVSGRKWVQSTELDTYGERVILQFMYVGCWAGVTCLRYTVLTNPKKDETAVHCFDPVISVLVMLMSRNVFHVVSALQSLSLFHIFSADQVSCRSYVGSAYRMRSLTVCSPFYNC